MYDKFFTAVMFPTAAPQRAIVFYAVCKLAGREWAWLTDAGTWSLDRLDAKTWARCAYADRESLKHLGAVVRSYTIN